MLYVSLVHTYTLYPGGWCRPKRYFFFLKNCVSHVHVAISRKLKFTFCVSLPDSTSERLYNKMEQNIVVQVVWLLNGWVYCVYAL